MHCVCYRVTIGTCKLCVGACTCKCTCKCDNVHFCMDTYIYSSAHSYGCVVDGRDAMAAF